MKKKLKNISLCKKRLMNCWIFTHNFWVLNLDKFLYQAYGTKMYAISWSMQKQASLVMVPYWAIYCSICIHGPTNIVMHVKGILCVLCVIKMARIICLF